MKEEWKIIDDYPNYMVSNFGNVKSLNYRRTGKGHLLKQGTNHDGYKLVMLYNNHKSKFVVVHRLVAKAFIPNPLNRQEINHINLDKKDNKITNLEWCSHQENIKHRDIFNKSKGNSHLNKEDVKKIRKEKNKGFNRIEVWKKYKDKMSLSGFNKVWYDITWRLKESDK